MEDPLDKKVRSFRLANGVITLLKAEVEKRNKGRWYNKVSQADIIAEAIKEKYEKKSQVKKARLAN